MEIFMNIIITLTGRLLMFHKWATSGERGQHLGTIDFVVLKTNKSSDYVIMFRYDKRSLCIKGRSVLKFNKFLTWFRMHTSVFEE